MSSVAFEAEVNELGQRLVRIEAAVTDGVAIGCAASENSTGRSRTGFASARCYPTRVLPLAIPASLMKYRIATSRAVIRITRRPSIRRCRGP